MSFWQERLRQILINLIGNAIKFTKKGKIEIELKESIKASQKKDLSNIVYQDKDFNFTCEKEIKISVKDTGMGIKEDMLEEIFQPMTRGVASEKFTEHGLGLGLDIVKQLLQDVGGEIGVESEYGKGSRFYVTLPLHKLTQQLTEYCD